MKKLDGKKLRLARTTVRNLTPPTRDAAIAFATIWTCSDICTDSGPHTCRCVDA